jgi:hypothetical protein
MLLFGSQGPATAAQNATPAAKPFGLATVRFEQNVTDKDTEAVFEVQGDNNGLVALTVTSPGGRAVIDFKTSEGSLGIRKFIFESPEPGDVATLKAAYPEGEYVFTGTTSAGVRLEGRATLRHALPPTAAFVHPRPEAEDVPAGRLEITWSPIKGLAACIVAIEQEEQNVSIEARLPGTATKFVVPDGFLAAGTEYKLAIGTVTRDGNGTFVETTIKTAAKKAP